MRAVIEEFLDFIQRLREAETEDDFRRIWKEYENSVAVGSLEDYWMTKLLERFGTPSEIFRALQEGKEVATFGDLKNWSIERASQYEYKEEG